MAFSMVGTRHPWSIRGGFKPEQVPDSRRKILHKMDISRGPGRNHGTKHTLFLQTKHTFPIRHTSINHHRQQDIIHEHKFSRIRHQVGHHPTLPIHRAPSNKWVSRACKQGDPTRN